MKNKRIVIWVFLDYITALLSWFIFFYARKSILENAPFVANNSFYYGIILVPIFWVFIHFILGTYIDLKKISRLKAINLSFQSSILGAIILFFGLILDDEISDYTLYYKSFFLLFLIHFFILIIPRFLLSSIQVWRIKNRKDAFKTILLGGSDKALEIYNELDGMPKSIGNQFIGYINLNGSDRLLDDKIPYLGHVNNLKEILANIKAEEVIIAIESSEHERLKSLISRVMRFGLDIKILPDTFDILSGHVKLTNIFGALLIEVKTNVLPVWQQVVKRLLDIVVSLISLILLFPFFIIISIFVRTSSEGPIFFLQERIGKHGKPFQIIKFRTMVMDAEKAGPQLSSDEDPRITKVGRFLRKTRIDEFPQFLNVILGDMSLVGPRPERQFYIDQIIAKEPQFLELNSVRPGITSWGQVKFGYASTVEEMIKRMKYDLLYLKNRSLAIDFKILLYTILIIIKREGK